MRAASSKVTDQERMSGSRVAARRTEYQKTFGAGVDLDGVDEAEPRVSAFPGSSLGTRIASAITTAPAIAQPANGTPVKSACHDGLSTNASQFVRRSKTSAICTTPGAASAAASSRSM